MLSVMPRAMPITPQPPRSHTYAEPTINPAPEQITNSGFYPKPAQIPGTFGGQLGTCRPRKPMGQPSDTTSSNIQQAATVPIQHATTVPQRFSPNNPFTQGVASYATVGRTDENPVNPFEAPPTTTMTPTSISVPGQVEDQTMRIGDYIAIPPPAPRIQQFTQNSPNPIAFHLPEAGGLAEAARQAHGESRAEPWGHLETWIHTAMRELGEYLEVNFVETWTNSKESLQEFLRNRTTFAWLLTRFARIPLSPMIESQF